MSRWKILHNPKCGTSRKVLDALKAKSIEPEIVEYLKTPPTIKDLDDILKQAGLEPADIVRKKESLYSDLKLADRQLSRSEWLKILTDNPILIERPIVTDGRRAVLARPPEKLEALF